MQRADLSSQLLRAAGRGTLAEITQLIKQGADLNTRDSQGRTPLMIATHENRPDVVRTLLDAGADVNMQDNQRDNPFLYAGAEGLLDILKLTIAVGADTRLTNRYGGTALIPAAHHGHVEVVAELLSHTDIDVNHVNNLGWTALLEAIILGDGGARHQRIVQLLIDHGADIRIADKDGVTPLQHARTRGYAEITRILQIAEGRLRPATKQDLALIDAARNGDAQAVKALLSQGANVHAADGNGVTALIAAAYGDHVAIGEMLIAAGADVNVQDNTKQSAYLIPTADGSLAFLQLTLRSGADVHSTDSYNGTGLIRAADRGHVDVIAELLKTEIKVNHVNRLGWTAVLEAIILGDGGPRHTEVVRLLIAHGADVNLADSEGVTPLAHAQRRGFAEIAAMLVKAGGH